MFFRQFWNILFPKPKTVNDPEFGILTLDWTYSIEVPPKPPQGLWIGEAHFAPLGRSVTVKFLKESERGSTPFQRELYHSVEARWDSIRDELARQLIELIHEWSGDDAQTETPPIEQFFQDWVRLNGIFVRNSSPAEPQWADAVLGFSILPGALSDPFLLEVQEHFPSVKIKDGRVVCVTWA